MSDPKKSVKPVKSDETAEGGLYIVDPHHVDEEGVPYGGRVVTAEGAVVAEFGDDEVNPGKEYKPAAPKPRDVLPPPQSQDKKPK